MKTKEFETYFNKVNNLVNCSGYCGKVNIHPTDANVYLFMRYKNEPDVIIDTVIEWINDENRDNGKTGMITRFLDVNKDNLELMNYIWIKTNGNF